MCGCRRTIIGCEHEEYGCSFLQSLGIKWDLEGFIGKIMERAKEMKPKLRDLRELFFSSLLPDFVVKVQ